MEESSGEEYYEEEFVTSLTNSLQEWMLDSIAEYLKSPAWKNPIIDFIDHHCQVFDAEDENKLEYTKIHQVLIYQSNQIGV